MDWTDGRTYVRIRTCLPLTSTIKGLNSLCQRQGALTEGKRTLLHCQDHSLSPHLTDHMGSEVCCVCDGGCGGGAVTGLLEASKVKETNKAKQHSTPKAVTFQKKNELPWVAGTQTHDTLHFRQSAC